MVAIVPELEGDDNTIGTGWTLHAKRSLILTNQHVIEGSSHCKVYFPAYEAGQLLTSKDFGWFAYGICTFDTDQENAVRYIRHAIELNPNQPRNIEVLERFLGTSTATENAEASDDDITLTPVAMPGRYVGAWVGGLNHNGDAYQVVLKFDASRNGVSASHHGRQR